nr:hypothetical protein [Tanacetum cinerariifolium]
LDGYGIEGLWLSFGALIGAATGSMMRVTTGSEFKIGDSVWTTEGGREEEVVGISQPAVEKFGVDEPELGKPGLDKPVLDKLEVGFDHG